MKHTPGPWTISENSGFDCGFDCCFDYGFDYGDTIYSIYCSDDWVNLGINISRIEDARLIAAAPELLNALVMVLDDTNALEGRDRTYTVVKAALTKAIGLEKPYAVDWLEQVRAAIAKATGN